eukprot:m.117433 g.117433  ORF g.117433 m.117433 type:complete len:309 (-) comp15547_c0_seq5:877-1803(-)
MDFFRSVSDFFAGTGQRDTFVGSRISLGGVVLDVEAAIAEGGFGIVYKCRDDANKLYALKKMLAHDHSHMKPIRREIETIRRIWREGGHDNIIQLIQAASSNLTKLPKGKAAEFLLLTPFYEAGNLMQYLERRSKPLSLDSIGKLFKQAASAVAFLHALSPIVIHRDVKAENYLVGPKGKLKLCDFGSVTSKTIEPATLSHREKMMAEEAILGVTTPQNRTPEMLDLHSERPINEKVDIWALGCLLYVLAYRKHPFEDGNKLAICNGKYKLPDQAEYQAINTLIKDKLLHQDPNERLSALEASVIFHS